MVGMGAATEAGDSEEVLEEDLEVVDSVVDLVADSEEASSVEEMVATAATEVAAGRAVDNACVV